MRIVIVLILSAVVLLWFGTRPAGFGRDGSSPTGELVLLCAAGVRKPAEAGATSFTADQHMAIRFQFGGSGQLLASLGSGVPSDVFLAADASFIRLARDKGLIREAIPLASQRVVLAVATGNPKQITSLSDLLKPGIRLALANPESASLGKTVQRELTKIGRWDAIAKAATVMKPTAPDLLNDLTIGAVDAAFQWDANAKQAPNVTIIELPELAGTREEITAAVTTTSKNPQAALRLLRWMASPEHGNPVWIKAGYEAVRGDTWATRPTLLLYSGAVNRPAVQDTLKEFADRENVEITTVFNGCGMLCAAMKQGAASGTTLPDIYYACDICFVAPVAERFPEAVILTEADIVIAVPKGNPRNINSLADLAQPGLKLGIYNAMQSTLGYMTERMIIAAGLRDAIRVNVASEVPTGDLLINQLRTGALDAAIVCSTNVMPLAAHLTTISIAAPGAKAMQSFAIAKDSPHTQLAQRLLAHLRLNRARFETAGFRWRGDAPAVPSASFPSDPTDANRPK